MQPRALKPWAMACLAALLVTLSTATPARAAGAVLCVSPSGAPTTTPCSNSTAFTSLQAAVDRAQPGDTIQVARGVYISGRDAVVDIRGTLLTIIGGFADGAWAAPTIDPALTLIDGQSARRGVQIESASVAFVNLTIQNGRAGSPSNYQMGGGLLAEQNQQFQIIFDSVVVRSSYAGGSGGGAAIFGPAEFYDVQFLNNGAGEDGGGFWAPSTLVYAGGSLSGNVAARDGGGGIVNMCACSGLSFRANTATSGSGGALDVYGTPPAVVTIDGSSFVDNLAGAAGGAVSSVHERNKLTVRDSVFLRNKALSPSGPGFDHFNDGGAVVALHDLTVLRSRFVANQAMRDGGAIAQGGYTTDRVTISDSLLQGNSAGDDGGAVKVDGQLTVSRSLVHANTAARHGGGLLQEPGATGRPRDGRVIVSASSITDNKANTGSGGGISTADALTLEDTLVRGNTAGQSGGGIEVMMSLISSQSMVPVQISGSQLMANRAVAGQGGGAYIVPNGPLTLRGVSVVGNSAGAQGGGIAQEGAETVDMVGVLLADNSAGQPGAAYAVGEDGMGRPIAARLTNVTVASAQPRTGVALAFRVSTTAITLTNTVVTSHTTGLALGIDAPGYPLPRLAANYVGLFGITSPVVADGAAQPFAPAVLISADPRFADPARGDYRLRLGSPLIGQGDPSRSYSGQRDYLGQPVPTGGRADIGADEFANLTLRLYVPLVRTPALYPPLP